MLSIPSYWYFIPVASLVALGMALFFYRFMKRQPGGNQKMEDIARYVRVGAYAYLKRQYKTVSIVFGVLFVVFLVLALLGIQNPFVPVAFLTGGFFSGLCGFLGMKTATYASSRTANGAISSLNRGLVIAFRSGAVMGLIVVGFGLLDISAWFFLLNYIYDHNVWQFGADIASKLSLGAWNDNMVNNAEWAHAKMVEITTTMLTFGMGASLQALFARVGGGIYTKAADVGADLVGKVEAGIPEVWFHPLDGGARGRAPDGWRQNGHCSDGCRGDWNCAFYFGNFCSAHARRCRHEVAFAFATHGDARFFGADSFCAFGAREI